MCCRIPWTRYSRRRVKHTGASPARAGTCRSEAKHPTRCYGCTVVPGVRARGRRQRLWSRRCLRSGNECACYLPIIRYACIRLSYSSPYRVPAPVDHIYYNNIIAAERGIAGEICSVQIAASNALKECSIAHGITMSRVNIFYARVINSTATSIQRYQLLQ